MIERLERELRRRAEHAQLAVVLVRLADRRIGVGQVRDRARAGPRARPACARAPPRAPPRAPSAPCPSARSSSLGFRPFMSRASLLRCSCTACCSAICARRASSSRTSASRSISTPRLRQFCRTSVEILGDEAQVEHGFLAARRRVGPFYGVAPGGGRSACGSWTRRGGRVVEGGGLENRRRSRVRGFESLPLRQCLLTSLGCASLRAAASLAPRWRSLGRAAMRDELAAVARVEARRSARAADDWMLGSRALARRWRIRRSRGGAFAAALRRPALTPDGDELRGDRRAPRRGGGPMRCRSPQLRALGARIDGRSRGRGCGSRARPRCCAARRSSRASAGCASRERPCPSKARARSCRSRWA